MQVTSFGITEEISLCASLSSNKLSRESDDSDFEVRTAYFMKLKINKNFRCKLFGRDYTAAV